MTCTEKCWTPVVCEAHGNRLVEPAGRAGADYLPCDCKNTVENTRHLWDEHDSCRWYFDKEGWTAHETACLQPNGGIMNRLAIEAGQKALRDWEGGYDDNVSEHVISDILEAARPHLEAEVRAEIAAKIRETIGVGPDIGEWEETFKNGLHYAARIAEGKR